MPSDRYLGEISQCSVENLFKVGITRCPSESLGVLFACTSPPPCSSLLPLRLLGPFLLHRNILDAALTAVCLRSRPELPRWKPLEPGWLFLLVCGWVGACSVMSDSLQPHGLEPARLLGPWGFLSKSTRVGCHFHLQGIFQKYSIIPLAQNIKFTFLAHSLHDLGPVHISSWFLTAQSLPPYAPATPCCLGFPRYVASPSCC